MFNFQIASIEKRKKKKNLLPSWRNNIPLQQLASSDHVHSKATKSREKLGG